MRRDPGSVLVVGITQLKQLIVLLQVRDLLISDRQSCRFITCIYAIVEIAEEEQAVVLHRSWYRLCILECGLDDRSHHLRAPLGLALTGCQVAIEECEGCFIYTEADRAGAFVLRAKTRLDLARVELLNLLGHRTLSK